MASKKKTVFQRFNKIPYQHEWNHATELVKLCSKGETLKYEECLDRISRPPTDMESERLGDTMWQMWLKECDRVGAQEVNLLWVLFKTLSWDVLNILFWLGIVRQSIMMITIESLRRLLESIELYDRLKPTGKPPPAEWYNLTTDATMGQPLVVEHEMEEVYQRILILATILMISSSSFYMMQSELKLRSIRVGIKCRIAMSQLVYLKSLRLHLSTSIKESSSAALSLISNEVNFMDEANKHLYYVLVGPWSMLLASTWLAMTQVSWEPVLMTLPFLLVFIGIQVSLPHWYKRVSQRRKEQTNKRIDIISAFLSSIKVVKMYAWESKFRERVQELRNEELKYVRAMDKFSIFDLISVEIMTKILCAVIFMGYLLVFDDFEAKILFTTSMAYTFCRADGLFYFPKGVKCLSDIRTACKNIKQYMLLEESQDARSRLPRQLQSPSKVQVLAKDLCISLVADKLADKQSKALSRKLGLRSALNVIDRLSLELESGELMFVVGPVGAGKSTLLLSLLGETRVSSGFLGFTEHSKFAYAAQEPCIFPDTFKNNILKGRPMQEARYRQVLDVCSLELDISLMPQGDETIIGPKGVTLSGGQKARLSLARAVYSQADIYLLDDPLSAVDTKVADNIFHRCIREFLAEKVVVLVTHQLQFLRYSKKMVLLRSQQAPIFGLTDELLAREDLRDFIEQFKAGRLTGAGQTTADECLAARETPKAKRPATSGQERAAQSSSVEGGKQGSSCWFMLRSGFNRLGLLGLCVLAVLAAANTGLNEYYYRIWSADIGRLRSLMAIEDESLEHRLIYEHTVHHWCVYVLITLTCAVVLALFDTHLALGLRRASAKLHDSMIDALFKAKMQFYDFCQMGELSSRYAADFATVDHTMLYVFLLVLVLAIIMCAMILTMTMISVINGLPYLLMLFVCVPIMMMNYGKLRILMELSKLMRAPVFTSIASSIDELKTIRSDPNHLTHSVGELCANQDRLTSMSLLAAAFETRLIVGLKACSGVVLACVFFIMFVILRDQLDVPTAGTFLLLTVFATGVYPALMEYGALLEASMVSVRNVRKFTQLEPEEEEEEPAGQMQQVQQRRWQHGQISFEQVSLRYFQDEPPAIDRLSFTIEGGQRVGVVGRTGAGKSSIVGLLYRLYPFEGRITIDQVDTRSMRLAELRASLGVIPQDPVLFNDSLRRNLDPFGLYDDVQLWRALEVVNLRDFVLNCLPLGLEHLINEGGRNFSVGQRQLVCLARAVLRTPKVLLIDEATANVDLETDQLIQRTIRQYFVNSTIVTIAHRLNTILDYDMIMVLDAGRMVEFDTVQNLLANESSLFRAMLNAKPNNEEPLSSQSQATPSN